MNKPVRILGIAGSRRRESYNRAALRAATKLVPEGVTLDVFELDGIPGLNQDDKQNLPEKVLDLKRRVRQADGILFVTPEYNYSVPGVLKNAIDWASRPCESVSNGKPVAIMGASIGAISTARAEYHLRQMMVFLNMFPVNQPEGMIGNAADRFRCKRQSYGRHNNRLHPKATPGACGVDCANSEACAWIKCDERCPHWAAELIHGTS